MARTFTIKLVPPEPNGQLPALMTDDLSLRSERLKYLRLLDNLTNEFLYQAGPMKWPRSSSGSWISFPLGTRVAICQWNKGEPDLWEYGLGLGTLTVMRIVTDETYQAICMQGNLPWKPACKK